LGLPPHGPEFFFAFLAKPIENAVDVSRPLATKAIARRKKGTEERAGG